MAKGERFVREFLLARARGRERWLVSLPLAALSALLLGVLFPRRRPALVWTVRPERSALTEVSPRALLGQKTIGGKNGQFDPRL
jgi:hypothetical protein